MLRIFSGRAGTGKTAAIMNEIKQSVQARSGRSILIVPEQYSHEAERELCSVCGDTLSLYGEVLSFTGLARKLNAEFGGGAAPVIDKGGRLLCMALAVEGLSSRLRVYSAARKRAELQSALLRELDALKASCISSERLFEASAECEGLLSDKLYDLALVLEAYDAVTASCGIDPSDRLGILADKIADTGFGVGIKVYIDGFTDFTAQERRIIEALLLNNAEVCICLGCDELSGGSEVFEPGRLTARHFIAFAEDNGIPHLVSVFDSTGAKAPALCELGESLFEYSSKRSETSSDCISLRVANGIAAECEFAAATAKRLVMDGCRWRDIAIAVRGFEDYRPELECMLSHYGVPFYSSRKTDIFTRPLPALISAAYEIIGGGWEADDIFDYLRTGLAGLSPDETDELENYVIMWQLRGNAWRKDADWRLHPDGFGGEYDESALLRLDRINALRRRVTAPLLHFEERSLSAATAVEQAEALAQLLTELELDRLLDEKTELLKASGERAAAQEYAQLWDICAGALEQCASILGDSASDAAYFGRLFISVLSKYDVGSIPAGLDVCSVGDFDRMRRRRIKHLFILGADDERLPSQNAEPGLFSDDEKQRLKELSLELGGMGDSELWREFSLIYNTVSLPSATLTLVYSAFDHSGEAQRPSIIVNRAAALFGLTPQTVNVSELRLLSPASLLDAAAAALSGSGDTSAAYAVCRERYPSETEKLVAAAELKRGSLSPDAVRALYGEKLRLSASRIDLFASCRFGYFMRYGLKAKPREPAGFTPPELGTFMHFVLEHTASAVMEAGGFKKVGDSELDALTDRFVGEYIRDNLNDFRERSKRFEYLFRRLIRDVRRIVRDTASELRCSDFVPLSFELDMSREKNLPPIRLGRGEDTLTLTGIVDRVDGWVHDGRLYLRVVDYKTGRKSFSLSDVWYGMNLQMLLYLFSLCRNGERLYGKETVPAGVLYVPARDVMLSSPAEPSEDAAAKKRSSELKRSGLLLGDPDVLSAMEHGDTPRYLPISIRGGKPTGDSLASAEQLGLLARHLEDTLTGMASELRRGSIAADPFYRTQQETACTYCKYLEACRFSDGENGECHRRLPKLPASRVWNYMEGGEQDG